MQLQWLHSCLLHRLTYNILLLAPSAGLISCFSVSAAGRYVVSGSASGAIKLWNLTEGMQLDIQEAAHPAGVSALAFLQPAVVCPPGTHSPCPRAEVAAGALCYCNYSSIMHDVDVSQLTLATLPLLCSGFFVLAAVEGHS